MPTRFNRQKGFTLVEVIITMVILTIILTLTSGIFVGAMNYWKQGEAESNAQDQFRISLNRISREFRQASSFSIPATGNSAGNPASNLVLVDWDGNTISFAVDGSGNLVRTQGENTLTIASGLTGLSTLYINDKCVEITLVAPGARGSTLQLSTRASLRSN